MGCGVTIVKYLVFLANLFFALAGLAILGVGVAIQLQINEITSLLDTSFDIAPTLAITLGAIVFVIAFFGCCGAVRESNCMLVLYSILLIILAIAKIIFVSLILTNVGTIESSVSRWLQETFNNYNTDNTAQISFNNLQNSFKCCGTTGPASYNNNPIPASCCASDATTCSTSNAYSTGCTQVLVDFLTTYANTLSGLILTIVGIEIVAVIFGLCLANHARNMDRRTRY